ncbi:MAG: DNA-3-methyladenine glycosylase 2 family protein [Ruminococcus sp.]|nr:DNA-3-methyladenine glycosylase 2 family protein [Ruminococcus sp.]MDE7099068.1 DNA-3-methyladenine glycosylase 2 family protein [Ruminococcus sp.]
MDYIVKNNNIIVYECDFGLDDTLDCGQAFRWKKIQSDYRCTYTGSFLDNGLTISEVVDGEFIFHDTTESDFLEKWVNYFDFETDYSELKKEFSQDKTLAEACKFAGGIRLLRQDSWECLISFILSQNNNIPRIKGIIDRLCNNYGGFPKLEQMRGITPESLKYLRCGFRDKYICDAVEQVNNGTVNLAEIAEMPINDARNALKIIKGVGNKVADCVLLFGMYRTEAFPVDVWIKRVLEEYYPNGFPKFSNTGIAQQYLFHYMRNKK